MKARQASTIFPIGEAREALPSELSSLVAEVRAAARAANKAEAEYVCQLALLARAAYGRRAAGGDAMTVCAKAVGLTRQTLQPFVRIALCWTKDELCDLLAGGDPNGRALTSSHLAALARLPRSKRAHWTERALTEGMHVRELRKRVGRTG